MAYGHSRAGVVDKAELRTVLLASADADFRARLRQQVTALRSQVREAGGGAEAMAKLETQSAEAMVLDTRLPDLEVGEFARQMRERHPVMDLLRVDEGVNEVGRAVRGAMSCSMRCARRKRRRGRTRGRRRRGRMGRLFRGVRL